LILQIKDHRVWNVPIEWLKGEAEAEAEAEGIDQ
jgi:hypothetical protein